MIDPVLQNPDIQRLMATADESVMRSFVQRWKSLNYRPENNSLGGTPGIGSYNRDGVQEGTSFLDTMKAAYMLHGIVGTAQRKIKGALSRADMIYDYQRVLPYSGKSVDVDEWYKKNKDSLSPNMRAAYIAGDLDDVETDDELYSALAYIGADDAYRADLSNARGAEGFAGSIVGGLADPGSLALTAGVGKLGSMGFSAIRQAKNAQLAAQIAANAGRATKVSSSIGVAGRVGENVAVGAASNLAQETALHAMDWDRTADDTISTLATGVIFDSFLAAGFAAATRTPIRSQRFAFVERPAENFTLKDIEADIDSSLKRKADARAEANRPITGDQLDIEYPTPEVRGEQLGLFGQSTMGEQLDLFGQPKARGASSPRPAKEADLPLFDREIQYSFDFAKELADDAENAVKGFVSQDAPEDFVEGFKALKQYEDFAMEEIAARKAATETVGPQSVPVIKGGEGEPPTPPAKAATPAPQPQNLRGYDVYEIHQPGSKNTQAALNFLDKWGQGAVPFVAPMSKLERTKSSAFKMLLAKVYQTRLPPVGAFTGEIKPTVPYELVHTTLVRKQQSIDNAMGRSFRQLLKATDRSWKTKVAASSLVPEELWTASVHQKASDYYDLVDAIRAVKTATFQNDDPNIGAMVKDGLQELRVLRGEEWLNRRISALGYTGREAELEAHIVKLYEDIAPVAVTMRERLRRPIAFESNQQGRVLNKADRLDRLYDESLSVKLISNDNDRLSMDDFARFWTLITETDDFLGLPMDRLGYSMELATGASKATPDQIERTLSRLNREMRDMKLSGITDEDVAYLKANPLATDNRAYRAVNVLRDFYMNHYGGYVPPGFGHNLAVTFRKANGSFGVEFDARRSIALRTRALEQVELGLTLRDYIKEASQWDKTLEQNAAQLVAEYNELRANRAFGLNWDGPTNVYTDPNYGFIKDLKDWNTKALRLLEENITTHEIPALSLSAEKVKQYPEIAKGDNRWLEKEKELIGEGFRHIRQRTGLEIEASGAAEQTTYNVLAPTTRNFLLVNRAFNNSLDIASTTYATAMSPFKGDLSAMVQGMRVDMEGAAARGVDRGALVNNIEYLNHVGMDMATRYFNDAKHVDVAGRMAHSDTGVPVFSAAEKFGAFQSTTAGTVIDNFSLGNFTQEFGRSMAAHSTLYQVFSKDGLVLKMDKALDDMAAGMKQADAFRKHGLNNYWGLWAREYLTDSDIREAAKLIREDVSRDVVTPLRFGMSRFFGDVNFKVVDLPETTTPEVRAAIENVAMFANHLMTKEKMAHPGWLDDITGTNRPLMRLVTFWMRPSAAAFNKLFVSGSLKGGKSMAGAMLAMTATAVAADVLKAEVYGRGDAKLTEIENNWVRYVAGRAAWTSVFGVQGEKIINWSGFAPNERAQSGMFAIVPLAVLEENLKGIQGYGSLLTGGEIDKRQANTMWRMLNLSGIPAQTLGARLMGNAGRIMGVNGEESSAVDLQAQWRSLLGAGEKR